MLNSYLSHKFGVNLLNGFREKGILRTTDARATALALLIQ